jgi:hypothetical protein
MRRISCQSCAIYNINVSGLEDWSVHSSVRLYFELDAWHHKISVGKEPRKYRKVEKQTFLTLSTKLRTIFVNDFKVCNFQGQKIFNELQWFSKHNHYFPKQQQTTTIMEKGNFISDKNKIFLYNCYTNSCFEGLKRLKLRRYLDDGIF